MADDPENIVLVYLRRMDAKLDSLSDDMRDVRGRLVALELELARSARDRADGMEARAHLQARVDRLRDDVDRIKRRLDIADEPPAA